MGQDCKPFSGRISGMFYTGLWRIVGSQFKPGESLLQHEMKEQGLTFEKTSSLEFVSKFYCNSF